MNFTVILFFLMTVTGLNAQWTGTYSGLANGDKVVMTLAQNGNSVTGEMNDSYQIYAIEGTVTGQQLTGTATEKSLNLVFDLKAIKSGNLLECTLVIDVFGNLTEMSFSVEKEGESTKPTTQQTASANAKIPFPSGATFPAALAATWVQNESYNSGSGDNFMGANFSQSMTFHSDGTLSDGGSSASMSGSNYSNQSAGAGSGKIEGIGWYAIQKNLYVIALDNGTWTSVLLGTWYAENNHLLITGTNGEKLLLSR